MGARKERGTFTYFCALCRRPLRSTTKAKFEDVRVRRQVEEEEERVRRVGVGRGRPGPREEEGREAVAGPEVPVPLPRERQAYEDIVMVQVNQIAEMGATTLFLYDGIEGMILLELSAAIGP